MERRAVGELVATASGAYYFQVCVLLQPQEQRDELCAVWLSYEQLGAGIHDALRRGEKKKGEEIRTRRPGAYKVSSRAVL